MISIKANITSSPDSHRPAPQVFSMSAATPFSFIPYYNIAGLDEYGMSGRPRIRTIIAAACEAFDVHLADFLSNSRRREVTWPRFAVALKAKQVTFYSYPQIATALNRKDHTTVIYGVARAKRLLAEDEFFAERYRNMEQIIEIG